MNLVCVEHTEKDSSIASTKSLPSSGRQHNGESKWTNGMARRLPLPLAPLALPNSPNTTAGLEAAATAAAKFLPLLFV